ncbi:unnamed protein product [Blumeria hordei]|uniref:RGS domain-containing protein n=1 Tax=Blumeria hordei TaxID=2867405 RepID=A0A383UZJ9_BLUHO|nr:unnamed protein product [Blumeria hordei]
MALLFYRRPDYLAISKEPITASDCTRFIERAKNSNQSIPTGLAFKEVLANRSLPPCGLGDFMDYLYYIEGSAENLQFYLWFSEYIKRFDAVSEVERMLSPAWKVDSLDTSYLSFEEMEKIAEAGESTSILQSLQPMRNEVDNIIRLYIEAKGPRSLNLSALDRAHCLHALRQTTHPTAFLFAIRVATLTLQGLSHPNFIRWSICNGNKPRVLFLRSIAIFHIIMGFVVASLMVLSSISRWYRLMTFLPWYFGSVTIVASYKGLCILLHSTYARDLRPWEEYGYEVGNRAGPQARPWRIRTSNENLSPLPLSNDPQRPMHGKELKKRGLWARCFGNFPTPKKFVLGTTWAQDENLKALQDRIALGAFLWGAIFTIPLVALSVALPELCLY